MPIINIKSLEKYMFGVNSGVKAVLRTVLTSVLSFYQVAHCYLSHHLRASFEA